MAVLVAGGAGYLGAHIVAQLQARGERVVALDNLSNGHRESVDGAEFSNADLCDPVGLRDLFAEHHIRAVVHCAGTPSATIAARDPATHYQTELVGTLNLTKTMLDHDVHRIVYISTARVYGRPKAIPIDEENPVAPNDPLGRAKAMVEDLFAEIARSQPLRYCVLRVFNASGACAEGTRGEARRLETHLIPLLFRSMITTQSSFTIHGNEYDTPDGTAIRDFVHGGDVARAAVLALEKLDDNPGQVFNIGSGQGYSVLEVVNEAMRLSRANVAIQCGPRRSWDPPATVASIDKARVFLGWEPRESDLAQILGSSWQWHSTKARGARRPAGTTAVQESAGTELFGDIAVRLGYVEAVDVVRALERQRLSMAAGDSHKLIGMHMLEMGVLSTSQLIEILRYYNRT